MEHRLCSGDICSPPPEDRLRDSPAPDPSRHSLLQWTNAGGSAGDVLSIHEYERERLAQELHDSAGQLLVALELSVTQLKLAAKNCGHGALIEQIASAAHQIEREIRSLAFLRRPVELEGRCLSSALRSLVLGFGKRSGIHATFEYIGDRSPVGDPVSIAILRVTQEALANIHRHSRASKAEVVLERKQDAFVLTISDDGTGFPSFAALRAKGGVGLQGMRHRIQTLGGEVSISNLKPGAKICAVVPVATPGSADS